MEDIELKYEKYGPRLIPREILVTGEDPLYETRPLLWVRLIGPISFIILGMAAVLVAFAFIGESVILLGVAAVLLIGLLWLLFRYLRWRYTIYAVTNKRILRQTGIIGKDYIDCPLNKVQNIYLKISITGRLFGFGTVRMATAGAAWVEIHWEGVKAPRNVQRILNEVIEKHAKGRSGT